MSDPYYVCVDCGTRFHDSNPLVAHRRECRFVIKGNDSPKPGTFGFAIRQRELEIEELRADLTEARRLLDEAQEGELKNALAVGQACIELREERNENEQLRAEQKHNRLVIAQHEEHLGRVLEELTEAHRLLADLNKVVIDLMLAAAPVPAQPSAESTCAWSENDDGFYETECGNSFQFIDGGAADNHATYCQYCGKKIDEHWFDDMPEGDTK